MKVNNKKFISLFLVFSLMILYVNLYAKEKRGVKLIIYRKSEKLEKTRLEGTPREKPPKTAISGELIAVKDNSLILLDTERRDVSVDIVDIKKIVIVGNWKSKALLPSLLGAGLGAGLGFVIGIEIGRPKVEEAQKKYPDSLSAGFVGSLYAIGGGLVGAVVGGCSAGLIVGGLLGKSEIVLIEGMTDSEIQKTLDKLRKKARIRDYK